MAHEDDEEHLLSDNQDLPATHTDNEVAEVEDESATRQGETPLLIKLERLESDEDVENYLNDQGGAWKIDVNTRSSKPPKQTPLHIAIGRNFIRTIQLLLEAGADFMALDDEHRQPLHLACREGNDAIARILIDHGASTTDTALNGWSTVHYASLGDADIQLLRRILEVDHQFLNHKEYNQGWTAINLSTYLGEEEVVEALLERYPDLRKPDDDGWTPLMTAVKQNHVKIFRGLINRLTNVGEDGATPYDDDYVTQVVRRQENEDGKTVLMELLVAGPEFHTSEAIVSLGKLLRRLSPQSANIVDREDRTVLDHAMQLAENSNSFSPDMTMELLKWVPQEVLLRPGPGDQTAFERAFGVDSLHQLLKIEQQKSDTVQNVSEGPHAKKQLDIPKQAGPKHEASKRRKQTRSQLLEDLEDILDFSSVEQSRGVEELLEIKNPTKDQLKGLEGFYAAVVGLRIDDQEFSRASKFRKVKEIIYGDSRIRTLGGTIDNLRKSDLEANRPATLASTDTRNNFTWIHLPAANMTWMMDTTKKILNQSDDLEETEKKQLVSFLGASWAEVPDDVQVSRFMQPRLVKMKPPNGKGPEDTVSAFYMPFLIVEDYEREKDDNCENKAPAESSHSGSLDLARKPLHRSTTLDEHYYHFATDSESKKDRVKRNESQMVTKHLHGLVDANDSSWPLLRVSQLWAWTIQIGETKWLVTSTSCAKTEKSSTFVNNVLDHLRRRVKDGNFRQGPRSPIDLSKIIVEYCIETYWRQLDAERFPEKRSKPEHGRPQPKTPPHPPQMPDSSFSRQEMTTIGRKQRSIRHIFSDYVNNIGRQEVELFRKFCIQRKEPNGVDNSIESSQRDTRRAAELLFEIKDIRDELNILRTVVEYQRKVQSSIDNTALEQLTVRNPEFDRDLKAKYVRNDIDELDRLAKNIQGSLQTTIQLHESEIANCQAMIGNRQAVEATAQGNRIMVFTYVTVGFVPLSFLTSLFALDVESFMRAPWWSLVVIFVVPALFLWGTKRWMNRMEEEALEARREAPMLRREEV
ncbi:uncharacterized protein CCOS01_09071 [Colletotrichum costaricense]|uniref:Ankyrin repeat protein n=1 Tax=Colletotrichum costaricense TaxID=1209916 RepID=A0AAI9YUJ9_9PEZI|nr:uncharacterized protein CCOS01_09071 [Colletotrichum costaricense]KAK1523984.1 hypothetical protein CCOS01_09071 [Colletotrichum costaricense]